MNLNLISKYRTQLLGFATLWVAMLHAQMWFSFPVLQAFKLTGHGGVEMFLFLSSFGLYYASLKGESGWMFFRKRVLRILPSFVPAVLFRILYLKLNLIEAIRLLTTTAFWITGDRSTWFISALVVLYALTPLYLKIFKRNPARVTLLCTLGSVIISLFSLDTPYVVFFCSVPCYVLGFLAGYYSYKGVELSKKTVMYLLAILIMGFVFQFAMYQSDVGETLLFGKGMYWYPHILIVWPLCQFLSAFFEWVEGKAYLLWISKCMKSLGVISLEFYLIHELFITFWSHVICVFDRYAYHGIVLNTVILILTYIFCRVWHSVTTYFFDKVLSK